MNIYLHELRSLGKSTILWTCALIGLAALFLLTYPGIAGDAADFRKLLGGYPPAVRAMLGINLDSVTSIPGFYSMIFPFIALCGAIQAMNLGVSVLSKETRERTADFLLVKPVRRRTIVSAKLLAAFSGICLTNIVFCAASAIIANAVRTSDFSNRLFLMINLTMFFLQLIFLSIGMAVSVFFRRIKNVLPISLGVVFGFYILGALIAAGKNIEKARYLSPFQYFNLNYIIRHSGYEAPYLIAGAIIIAVSVAAAYVIYSKKDIRAV